MNKARSLHVFGTRYRLKRLKRLLQRGVYGECDKHSKTIAVDASLEGDEYWETLIHEAIHAVFSEVSLHQAIDCGVEEIVCDTISKMVVKNFTLKHKT